MSKITWRKPLWNDIRLILPRKLVRWRHFWKQVKVQRSEKIHHWWCSWNVLNKSSQLFTCPYRREKVEIPSVIYAINYIKLAAGLHSCDICMCYHLYNTYIKLTADLHSCDVCMRYYLYITYIKLTAGLHSCDVCMCYYLYISYMLSILNLLLAFTYMMFVCAITYIFRIYYLY